MWFVVTWIMLSLLRIIEVALTLATVLLIHTLCMEEMFVWISGDVFLTTTYPASSRLL